MNVHVLNISLLIGWLMAVVGACMASLAFGLVFGGLLLIALCAFSVKFAGIYIPGAKS